MLCFSHVRLAETSEFEEPDEGADSMTPSEMEAAYQSPPRFRTGIADVSAPCDFFLAPDSHCELLFQTNVPPMRQGPSRPRLKQESPPPLPLTSTSPLRTKSPSSSSTKKRRTSPTTQQQRLQRGAGYARSSSAASLPQQSWKVQIPPGQESPRVDLTMSPASAPPLPHPSSCESIS